MESVWHITIVWPTVAEWRMAAIVFICRMCTYHDTSIEQSTVIVKVFLHVQGFNKYFLSLHIHIYKATHICTYIVSLAVSSTIMCVCMWGIKTKKREYIQCSRICKSMINVEEIPLNRIYQSHMNVWLCLCKWRLIFHVINNYVVDI